MLSSSQSQALKLSQYQTSEPLSDQLASVKFRATSMANIVTEEEKIRHS